MKHGRHARPLRKAAKSPASNRAGVVVFTILVLVVGGLGAAYIDMEIVRGEFYNRGDALNTLRGRLAEARRELDTRTRVLDERQNKDRHLDSLDQDKQVLLEQIAVMEREMAAARTDLANTVRDVRAKAAGTTLAELRLMNGQVLNGVRFLNVSNSEISVSHDRGMLRLPAANLPLDLQDRFRFGTLPSDPPDSVKSSSSAQALAQPAAAPSPASYSVPSTPPPPAMDSTTKAQRMQTLNSTVVGLRARLFAMEAQQRSDSAKEVRRTARTERLYPSISTQMQYPYQTTKTIDQLEREQRRKQADDAAKLAATAAKNKEMDALRWRISQIEGEIQRITNGN
jgi:hypothetical protein